MRRIIEMNRSRQLLAVWLPMGLAFAGCLSIAGCDSTPTAPATPAGGAGSAAHGGPPGAASHGGPAGQHEPIDETGEFATGKKVFRSQCAKCHSLDVLTAGGPGGSGSGGPGFGGPGGPPGGRGGPGSRAPNLSKVGADPDHTVEWLVGYIREPKSIKENSRMPPMEGKISDADIQAVAEYLASLK